MPTWDTICKTSSTYLTEEFFFLRNTLKVGGEDGAKLTKIGEKRLFFQESDLSFMFHSFFNGHGPGMDAQGSIDGLDMGIHRIIGDFKVGCYF
jgi:hypothetical protein